MNKKVLIVVNIALLLAAAVLVCLILGVGSKAEGHSWQERYDLGVRYYSEGDYEAAALAFRAAIDIDPSRPEAYQGAAQAYLALGDEEAAAQILKTGHSNTGDPSMKEWLDWYEDSRNQPAAPEPIPTEPRQTEPAPTEPPHTEPAPTEHRQTEPAPTEPAPTEPPQTEPAPTQAPAATEPTETAPVQENRFLTEDEVLAIACAYWDTQPGDINSDTGFLMGIQIMDGPTEDNPQYLVALRWLVDDGTSAWWSTLDMISVDAYTGAVGAPY